MTADCKQEVAVTPKDFFEQLTARYSLRQIADKLGLHQNTVIRWADSQRVPNNYAHDLRRLAGAQILPGNARHNGQYFTKKVVAKKCWQTMLRILGELGIDESEYHFIEPSAGGGRFYELLPPTRRVGIDIAPQNAALKQADYLLWRPAKKKKYIVVGNPPFGLRGHLALQFINHSAQFADVVAMILPQLFDSDGKGAAGKRVRDYALAHSEKLAAESFEYPDGKEVCVSTVFQVWTKINKNKIRRQVSRTCRSYMHVYSLSDGGTPASTRNKKMIENCDLYLPSTCFRGMRAYRSFAELPNQRGYGVVIYRNTCDIKRILQNHNWSETAFLSTNAALNLRRSLIESVIIAAGYTD